MPGRYRGRGVTPELSRLDPLRGNCRLCVFFSSRRRHTRCSRDWSSDVCSSDLHWYRRVIERAAAQLAGVVAAPAVSGRGPREPTSVAQGRGEGAEAQPTGDRDRNRTIGGRAVAELAGVVSAPAVGRPGAGEPTGVNRPGGEGAEAHPPGNRHRNRTIGGRAVAQLAVEVGDRKSTRLNSSHGYISYAVFCLKKKTNAHST